MSEIPEQETHEIVQRVLKRTMGQAEQPAVPGVPANPQPIEQPAAAKPLKVSKTVAIGSDHGGYELKEILKGDLAAAGYDVIDAGTNGKEAVDYPDFAHEVARLVAGGRAWRGIVIDGAGIGSCIAANKVPGVRAGMAYDLSSASNSREHNDTNVLTLGAGLIGTSLAKQIVTTWLATEFGGGRHSRRIDKIVAIEKLYLK
jgi:ribose 5-phosphate isomerase B